MDTKTKRRTPPGEPAYHRLTDEKRTIIETLRKEGRSLSREVYHWSMSIYTLCDHLFSCPIPFSCSPPPRAASRFLFSCQIQFSCSPSPAP